MCCREQHHRFTGTKIARKTSSGRVFGSHLEGRGFESCPMLDESGAKAIPRR